MEYSELHELISFLQNGTKLHIGVMFFGDFGGVGLALPREQTIHASSVCWEFKNREGGLEKCYRCRQAAIKKAMTERLDFGGFCINGVYEYTRPVSIDGKCVAIIFIGNIFCPHKSNTRCAYLIKNAPHLIDGMEHDFDEARCRALGKVIECYIRALHSRYPSRTDEQSPSLIENIKAYIATNLEYGISITDTARVFGYNAQYLGRLFKRECKMSFSDYVNNERIKLALTYLLNGESVTVAAFRVGFNNVSYFNRSFKRQFGISPTEYIKRQ